MKTVKIRLNREAVDKMYAPQYISLDGKTVFGKNTGYPSRGNGLEFDRWYEAKLTLRGTGYDIIEYKDDNFGWHAGLFETEEEVHKEQFDNLVDEVLK